MSDTQPTPAKPPLWRVMLQPPMLLAMLMGFASGLPLLLTLRTLQAWMTEVNVDLKTIGIFALAGLPYSFKFVWAPLLDRYAFAFLGRRRGWMFLSQLGLIASIVGMALTDPKNQTLQMALLSVFVAFFSATQDIVIDAYRRESLRDEELGIGATLSVYGYRIAMLVSGAAALGMATRLGWSNTYLVMAGIMGLGLIVTLLAPEPQVEVIPPKTLRAAVIDPFLEFFTRRGALTILAFVLMYKLGDTLAGAMATPFYIKLGFTKDTIAAIAKTFGLFSNLGGSLLGGILIVRWGLTRSLILCGVLQALSTLAFSGLALIGPSTLALTFVIGFEDLSGGMGTAAFVTFMGSMTSKQYTATQYAALSSLMGVPRTLLAAPTGIMATALGWPAFFATCALLAIPGMLLIWAMIRLNTMGSDESAQPVLVPE